VTDMMSFHKEDCRGRTLSSKPNYRRRRWSAVVGSLILIVFWN